MKPTAYGKQTLSSEPGTPAILLWAAGPDPTFGYHSPLGRGAFAVHLLCADDQNVMEDEEQPSSGIVSTEPGSTTPMTILPSLSPDVFTASPTVAPTSTPPPQEIDDTSGAVPRLLQAGDDLLLLRRNLVGDIFRAAIFGLIAIGVSTASTVFF